MSQDAYIQALQSVQQALNSRIHWPDPNAMADGRPDLTEAARYLKIVEPVTHRPIRLDREEAKQDLMMIVSAAIGELLHLQRGEISSAR